MIGNVSHLKLPFLLDGERRIYPFHTKALLSSLLPLIHLNLIILP